jgi:hypothetical protein
MKSLVFCLRKEVTRSYRGAFLIQLKILLSEHDSCAGLIGKGSRGHERSFVFLFVLVTSLALDFGM